MNTLVKTTITIPEEIMRMAKMTAIAQRTNVSALIREALLLRLNEPAGSRPVTTVKADPLRYVGSLRAGVQTAYRKRADLYEKHLQRAVAR